MPLVAFYPGSFDPVTNGHLDVVSRACRLADRLVIGVGTHVGKEPLFSVEDRRAMLEETCGPLAEAAGAALEVGTFSGLATQAALAAGATVLIRGLRDGADFDYEMQLAGMNGELAPDVQTVFLPASPEARPVSATLVRQIASMGGDVSAFAPAPVVRRLTERFAR
jgi:pantetheine-phosphate adenylyltransferase